MHEELLGDGEERCPTAHPHIFHVRCNHISDRAALQRQIDALIALAEAQRNGEVVARLRELVLPAPSPSPEPTPREKRRDSEGVAEGSRRSDDEGMRDMKGENG